MDRIEKILVLLGKNPGDNFLRHALALEYIKMGNDGDAKELFIAILTNSPDYIGSYYHLAKLLERNRQIDAATEWYEKGMAAARKVSDNHAYNVLNSAYHELVD